MRLTDAARLAALAATLFIALAGFVAAKTFSIPQGDPIATVSLPANWKTDEHAEFIEAVAPDQATHILVLGVEGRKVGESVGEAFRYIRGTDPMFVKPDQMKKEIVTVKGAKVQRLSWDATRKDQPIVVCCYVITVSEGKQLLVMFWGSAEAQQKYQRELKDVFETLRPVGE